MTLNIKLVITEAVNAESLIRKLINFGKAEDLDAFVTHPKASIRLAIAKRGYPAHLTVLSNDSNPIIRQQVAQTTHSPNDLLTLATDSNEYVKNSAQNRIQHLGLDQ